MTMDLTRPPLPLLLLSIIVRLLIVCIHTPVDGNSSSVHIFTHLMKHTTGVTDICTSTCYLTNMYQLHKFDLDNKAPRPFAALLLLLLSGDIATNPGPAGDSMFPCAVCQYGVNWSHKAVACDNCSVWIHKTCASMDSVTYDQVENMSWRCYGCRSINVSSFVYNAYNLNVSNSFAPLAGIPGDDSVFLQDIASPTDHFEPGFHSSPRSEHQSRPSTCHTSSSYFSSHTSSLSAATLNNLRIAVVNANSVSGKKAEIAELCNTTQADVLIISETKLDATKNPSEFFPKNYETVARRDRNSSGGGVLIATKKGVVTDEVPLKASAGGEIVCTRIACSKSNPLYVCAYYRPPGESTDSLEVLQEAVEELADMTSNNTKSTVVLAGDFNARDIDWDELVPTSECKKKGLCNELISILGEAELHQMQRENTRQDAVLDLFCTNKPSFVKTIDTIPGISDHDGIILVDMTLKAQINKKPQRRVPVWSKADWDSMKTETTAFCDDFIRMGKERSVESNWELLASHLKKMQHKHIPSKLTSTRYNVPWLTTKLKRMCHKKRRLFRRAKKSTNPTHKAAYKHIQNETRNALRRAHWSYVNGILTEGLEQGDLKPFYGYMKSQHQDNQGVSPLRERGQLYSDAHSKARILSEQFRSVFTRDDAQSSAKRLAGPAHPPAEPPVY